jgi:hypothetical protein
MTGETYRADIDPFDERYWGDPQPALFPDARPIAKRRFARDVRANDHPIKRAADEFQAVEFMRPSETLPIGSSFGNFLRRPEALDSVLKFERETLSEVVDTSYERAHATAAQWQITEPGMKFLSTRCSPHSYFSEGYHHTFRYEKQSGAAVILADTSGRPTAYGLKQTARKPKPDKVYGSPTTLSYVNKDYGPYTTKEFTRLFLPFQSPIEGSVLVGGSTEAATTLNDGHIIIRERINLIEVFYPDCFK